LATRLTAFLAIAFARFFATVGRARDLVFWTGRARLETVRFLAGRFDAFGLTFLAFFFAMPHMLRLPGRLWRGPRGLSGRAFMPLTDILSHHVMTVGLDDELSTLRNLFDVRAALPP
jgi:hypothetical protein